MRSFQSWLWARLKEVVGELDWLPLISSGVLVGLLAWAFLENDLPGDFPSTILGFDGDLIGIAILGGFLGSFVRVLNRAVIGYYRDYSIIMKILVGFMRPVAGAMLGLFVLTAFGSGFLSMPIGRPEEEVFRNAINKGEAFIFAVAFVAGLVDEFVINIVDRFVVLGKRPEDREEPPKDEPKVEELNVEEPAAN